MSNPERRIGMWRLAWVVLVAVVVTGELLPAATLPIRALGRLGLSDKLEHFGAYFVLALLPGLYERNRLVTAIAASLVGLGCVLEFLQRLSPGRSFDLFDMAANAAGVLLGVLIALMVRRPREAAVA